MGILALTIAVVISVVIIMPIRIKLQFAKIECNMIQNSSLLIGTLSKTAIIKESMEKSWIVDETFTQESLFLTRFTNNYETQIIDVSCKI